MNRIINFILIAVLLLALAVPLAAQDVTDEPTESPTLEPTPLPTEEPLEPGEPTTPGLEVTPPDSAAEQLLTFLSQLFYLGVTAAGLVTTLTGFSKRILPMIDPALINLALSAGLWVIYWIASQSGNVALFDSLVSGFDVILTGLLGTIGTSLGAAKIYHVAKGYGIPVLGTPSAHSR